MIVLDTHIWIWWTHGSPQLPDPHRFSLQTHEQQGLGVSIISCWEVAKLVEKRRLVLPCPIAEWFDQALHYPGIQLLDLTPRIVADSTQLPGTFHRDPADQLIVSTARIYDVPLMTVDTKILSYPHVRKLP